LVTAALLASLAHRSAVAQDAYDPFLRTHWSLQPIVAPQVPSGVPGAGAGPDWPRTPVDLFLWEKIRAAGLAPAPLADRPVLVRRLAFDLLGLPPSPEEVAEFVDDSRVDAYERLVDRWLAHPKYGERQAQHWLDVVRFAETEGFEYDQHRPGAWRYRDYVIDSLNADKPFDQFTVEQIAGDELAGTAPSSDSPQSGSPQSGSPQSDSRQIDLAQSDLAQSDSAALIAVGFHRLGPVRRNAGNSDVAFSRNEVLTEMTDAVGSVFLGLTVGCARCHDHKFDPFLQEDYYRLQAYLASTHEHDVSLASTEETRRWTAETNRIKDEMKRIRELMQNADGKERERLVADLQRLDKTLPPPLPCLSSVRRKADEPASVAVLRRGQTDTPLATVGPRPPGVLESAARHTLDPRDPKPKTRLAQWLLASDNPLTSRVAANRLWQARFGVGIVATANDFGINGAAPSHPELLDYLAARLRAGQWQLKPLQRLLVTSAAYRQSSRPVLSSGNKIEVGKVRDAGAPSGKAAPAAATVTAATAQSATAQSATAVDPENRWLARYPRRRLDAEQLRDGLLAVAGRLDARLGGPSIMTPVEADLVNLLYKPAQWEVAANVADHHRRSVYLIAKRNLRLPGLELFDQPDLATSCSRRASSTHAPQALELLNGDFANDMALHLSRRIEREAGVDFGAQAERGFWLVAGRPPTPIERALSEAFLRERSPREFALALLNLNAFLYVD
jgi:hypothetical protein